MSVCQKWILHVSAKSVFLKLRLACSFDLVNLFAAHKFACGAMIQELLQVERSSCGGYARAIEPEKREDGNTVSKENGSPLDQHFLTKFIVRDGRFGGGRTDNDVFGLRLLVFSIGVSKPEAFIEELMLSFVTDSESALRNSLHCKREDRVFRLASIDVALDETQNN